MQKQFSIPTLLSCMLTLTACGGGGNENQAANNTPPPTPETRIVSVDMLGGRVAIPIEFIDAKTGKPITQKVTLTASDDVTGDNLYESANVGSADNKHDTGSTTIFLKADAVKNATVANPVKLRLVASADGYFSSSTDVIYNGSDLTLIRINLVNKAEPPAGVAVAVQKDAKADSTGTLSTALNLTATTTDTASKGASATFTLPSGTVLKDRNGEPLTGDLQVSIGYFSPKTENIGEVFPGGLNPDRVRTAWNSQTSSWDTQAGYFVTAGLLAVDIMDSQGRKAHLLENAQGEMTIQAPAGLINPETNQPIKDGDKIPVWSHNEANGLWQKELVGTFKQNATGNFDVTYKVKHLSYWNLDWHYSEVCPPVLSINFNKAFSVAPYVLLNIDFSDYGRYNTFYLRNSTDLTGLYNAPKGKEITFTLITTDGTVVGQGTKPANSCSTVNINVTGNFPKPRDASAQILLTAPQGFTKAEITTLLSGMKSLTDAQRTAVLKYTHPTDPNAKFKLDQAAYQKLMDIALTRGQVASLQALMSVQVKAQGYFSAYDQDWSGYYSQLSNTGGMTFYNLPSKDITFKGAEQQSYNWYDWWTGQTYSYTYTQEYAWLYGYVQNSNGSWKYFQIPLKSPHTIKKDDMQTTIIFEDMNAMQRILSYLNSQQTSK
ncbi:MULTISPECIES: hypothetical protein [unclassified Acinetobacter]|uniref:hypothetical protein n=1 Tax=unclassified Acinetobacter TaxID=196816 RepID=UPI0024472FE4|nr:MULTISPECIES: hypothetical protein [unclassified Acinetobacter]MDH0032890.1 hypothetical protein [Acinetobacter sp. GD04021]MDH0888296.1 hypothetical protein [Acinetobacter sp. GD03873]MDH1084681.1 hypothetical protein [Acinetobacter sp. GD03983]MDH2191622.1 hypothetical protein [Acinetobacter sp. GD03645]MDH2205233.1 hypothetical protein [Acinetobacter sp. GD03647]